MSKKYMTINLEKDRLELTVEGRLVLKDCYMQEWHRNPKREHPDLWLDAVRLFLAFNDDLTNGEKE
jgi:hypothetical protein